MRVALKSKYLFIVDAKPFPTNRNVTYALRWRHNGCNSVSNHQPHHCLLNRLFRRRSKKTSKLPVTGLCAGNSPGTGEFPAQMASYAENVSTWWRHHGVFPLCFSYIPYSCRQCTSVFYHISQSNIITPFTDTYNMHRQVPMSRFSTDHERTIRVSLVISQLNSA